MLFWERNVRYLVVAIVVLWMVVVALFIARTLWFCATLFYAGVRHLLDDLRHRQSRGDKE